MDKTELLRTMIARINNLNNNIDEELSEFFYDNDELPSGIELKALIGETEYEELMKEYDNMLAGLDGIESKITSYINEFEE